MRKMSKKFIAALLVIVMIFSMTIPVFAAPSSNRATIADLEVIVQGYVERHVENFLNDNAVVDGVLSSFEAFVAEIALAAINDMLSNTEGLIDFTSPMISAMLNGVINSVLAEISPNIPDVDVSFIVNYVLTSAAVIDAIDTILSIEIVNDIIQRTIEYAVADAIDYALSQIVFIPADADIIELSRRYAGEISGFNVVPFPLTSAFLGTSLSNQSLLVGHSFDLVNPFWAIEIHSHGFLNLQRTYRVTGWQRTANTNALDLLINLIPGVNLDINSFMSIENYVLARLGVDVAGGTYDGIVNFDVDAFIAALPAIVLAAAQRAVVDVITERIEAYIDYVVGLVEAEIRRVKGWVQSEIDAVMVVVRNAIRDAINVVLPIYTCVQETIETIRSRIDRSIELYFNTKEQIQNAINEIDAARARFRDMPFSIFQAESLDFLNNIRGRLEIRALEIVNNPVNQVSAEWIGMIADFNNIFGTELSIDMSADEVILIIADVINRMS